MDITKDVWTAILGTPSQGKEICILNTTIDDHHSLKNTYEKYADKLGVKVEALNEKDHKPILGMNVLVFSDCHGSVDNDPEEAKAFIDSHPDLDAVFILGDCVSDDLDLVTNWIPKSVPMFGVAGNHNHRDFYDIYDRITDIHGKVVTLANGVVIAGLAGTNRYKRDPKRAMFSQYESLLLADEITEASGGHIDILLSHDKAFIEACPDIYISHAGLVALTKIIHDTTHLSYHLHGHYHVNKTMIYKPSNTIGKCIYKMAYLQL